MSSLSFSDSPTGPQVSSTVMICRLYPEMEYFYCLANHVFDILQLSLLSKFFKVEPFEVYRHNNSTSVNEKTHICIEKINNQRCFVIQSTNFTSCPMQLTVCSVLA